MPSIGARLRKSLSRNRSTAQNQKQQQHPVITAASNLPPPIPLAPANAKTAKKSMIVLKQTSSSLQKKAIALEIINRYLIQQPHYGERYRIRVDELQGLEKFISNIISPSGNLELDQQVKIYYELSGADEIIMQTLRRTTLNAVNAEKHNNKLEEIVSCAQSLLVRKQSNVSVNRSSGCFGSIRNTSKSSITRSAGSNNCVSIAEMQISEADGNIHDSTSTANPSSPPQNIVDDNNNNNVAKVDTVVLNERDYERHSTTTEEDDKDESEIFDESTGKVVETPKQKYKKRRGRGRSQSIKLSPVDAEAFKIKRTRSQSCAKQLQESLKSSDDSNILLVKDLPDSIKEVAPVYDEIPSTSNDIAPVESRKVEEEIPAPSELERPIPPVSTSAPPPPPLPMVTGGPPPPPLPEASPAMGPGLPPPPPPPFLRGSVIKMPVSKKCVEYNKKSPTVVCRWNGITDKDTANTIYESIQPAELSLELLNKISASFRRKDPMLTRRSVIERPLGEMAISSLAQHKRIGLSIFLRKLEPMKSEELIKMITTCPNPDISKDGLQNCLKNFPTADELEPYNALAICYSNDEIDKFCFLLARTPSFKVLAELIVLKQEVRVDMIENCASTITLLHQALDDITQHYPQLSTLCARVWQFGNYLNQGSSNYGAAGFAFNDLNRILEMSTEDGRKDSVISFLIGNLDDDFKNEILKLLELKNILSEAGKQNLEDTVAMIEAASSSIKNAKKDLRNTNVSEEMKAAVLADLETIEGDIKQQKDNLQELEEKKDQVFKYLVIKNLKAQEFFIYLTSTINIIAAANEKLEQLLRPSPLNRTNYGRQSLRDLNCLLPGTPRRSDYGRQSLRHPSGSSSIQNELANTPYFKKMREIYE